MKSSSIGLLLFLSLFLVYNPKVFSQSNCLLNFQANLENCSLCRIILDSSNRVCNNSGQCYFVDTYVFQIPYVENGVVTAYLNHNSCIQVRQEDQLTLSILNSSNSKCIKVHSYINVDSLA